MVFNFIVIFYIFIWFIIFYFIMLFFNFMIIFIIYGYYWLYVSCTVSSHRFVLLAFSNTDICLSVNECCVGLINDFGTNTVKCVTINQVMFDVFNYTLFKVFINSVRFCLLYFRYFYFTKESLYYLIFRNCCFQQLCFQHVIIIHCNNMKE